MIFSFGNFQIFPHNYFFDFMKWRKWSVTLSTLLVLLSFVILYVKGINYSIDFLGGAEVRIVAKDSTISRNSLEKVIANAGIQGVGITSEDSAFTRESATTEHSYLIRIQRQKGDDENATTSHADVLVEALKTSLGADKFYVSSITNISGKVGKEDEVKGYIALLLACLGILIYIAFRFDARFAPGAVLCLAHNVIIALGFMTLLGKPFTTSSIAAFLTIVGYSINDTVIIYDRIREMRSLKPELSMVSVVNHSISQTLNRTILTSGTGILALLVLTFMGGGSIEDFALTMLIGILVGTYSSIYVAAPLTLMMDNLFVRWGWKSASPTPSSSVKKASREEAPPIYIRKNHSKEKK